MKKQAVNLVAKVLGWQVRRLYKKNAFKVVVVAGSIGKTSSKLAIVSVLCQKYKVRSQEGNYNHLVSVPLVFFGQIMPNPYNPLAWLVIFIKNEFKLLKKYHYEVVVIEVGTDASGQIAQMGMYLSADIGVLTAIAPEHMEFFKDLDAVADEELAITQYSKQLLANKDLCASKYLTGLKIPTQTYSLAEAKPFADPKITNEIRLYSVSSAVAVAKQLGLSDAEIKTGVDAIKPVNGRMQELASINGSTIIDDTYNASPEAVTRALSMIYKLKSPQKIAILGNMNELGSYSQQAHREIGRQCDPDQLALVATIGPDANAFLAPAAKANGCHVQTFDNPYLAGEYVKKIVKRGAVILAKGSQNKVFAEEAVKVLLANPADASKLVRQSSKWLKLKHKQFSDVKMNSRWVPLDST